MTDKRLLIALMTGLSLASGLSVAQPAPATAPGPTRLRGTIDAVGPDSLDVTTRAGSKTHMQLPGTARIVTVVTAKLSDIAPDSYIGTAAAPQPDGTLKALEVHIFPPSMRGSGEGFRPWDLEGGGSTMTNGAVGSLIGTSGRTATVKYGDGEKKIVIPDDVPIVAFDPSDRSALKPGQKVVVNGQRAADGSLAAASVLVGKDGLVPPM
jgi:hypothetical protein